MDANLYQIKTAIYAKFNLKISDFRLESESKEYYACRFRLNRQCIVSRNAKVTPKKSGQFVTFWKRNGEGVIEPHHESDQIDFLTVNVRIEHKFGQFVFPKLALIKKGILSTNKKEGKRAFRVYPKWDITNSKQAETTQKWQLDYFYEINDSIDYEKVASLYETA